MSQFCCMSWFCGMSHLMSYNFQYAEDIFVLEYRFSLYYLVWHLICEQVQWIISNTLIQSPLCIFHICVLQIMLPAVLLFMACDHGDARLAISQSQVCSSYTGKKYEIYILYHNFYIIEVYIVCSLSLQTNFVVVAVFVSLLLLFFFCNIH